VEWFDNAFAGPTPPQALGWPAIARGHSTLILAPTGSGKTLTAFLWCINRLMFDAVPDRERRCRVLYISPLKALAVDIERNLRAPLAGIANRSSARGDAHHVPAIAVRTGDTPAIERARFQRDPADILITTPESLYLLLTSNARDALRAVDTVIIDEIHALVPTKRGAHLSLSLERLEAIRPADAAPLQRIGLSATQRPLDEVARFLGGATTLSTSSLLSPASYRDVTIVDTSEKKRLDLTIEVPVEDMARIGQIEDIPSGPAAQGPVRTTIATSPRRRRLCVTPGYPVRHQQASRRWGSWRTLRRLLAFR
jgi:ATP-dependent Lhr-like helicase